MLVDASKDQSVWWFPQFGSRFDPRQPHQGKALADHLRGRGNHVLELSQVPCDLKRELRSVDLAIRYGDSKPHNEEELKAYVDFVRAGGSLLIVAGGRPPQAPEATRNATLAARFAIRFGGAIRGGKIDRWSEHPIIRDLPAVTLPYGSVIEQPPGAAVPLGRLHAEDGKEGSDLVLGVMPFGKGRIAFFISELLLKQVPQPLTDRLVDWLLENQDHRPGKASPEVP